MHNPFVGVGQFDLNLTAFAGRTGHQIPDLTGRNRWWKERYRQPPSGAASRAHGVQVTGVPRHPMRSGRVSRSSLDCVREAVTTIALAGLRENGAISAWPPGILWLGERAKSVRVYAGFGGCRNLHFADHSTRWRVCKRGERSDPSRVSAGPSTAPNGPLLVCDLAEGRRTPRSPMPQRRVTTFFPLATLPDRPFLAKQETRVCAVLR